MSFQAPWILARTLIDRMVASGLSLDDAERTVREMVRSTRPMPSNAAPGPAEPGAVRFTLPEVERLDYPLDAATLDLKTSTINASGKPFGTPYAMPINLRARIEFWAADSLRLFPPAVTTETKFRNAGDGPLITRAIAGIKSGQYANPLQAAKALASEGGGIDAVILQRTDRLRKAIAAIAKTVAKDRQP